MRRARRPASSRYAPNPAPARSAFGLTTPLALQHNLAVAPGAPVSVLCAAAVVRGPQTHPIRCFVVGGGLPRTKARTHAPENRALTAPSGPPTAATLPRYLAHRISDAGPRPAKLAVQFLCDGRVPPCPAKCALAAEQRPRSHANVLPCGGRAAPLRRARLRAVGNVRPPPAVPVHAGAIRARRQQCAPRAGGYRAPAPRGHGAASPAPPFVARAPHPLVDTVLHAGCG
mmetsp:Transcript_59602/g.172635  ORF Transcript_59602/g.172635 Transcript_59602/m.172635 type:complete len:229 (+) Transcript_59602:1314-2000(+)